AVKVYAYTYSRPHRLPNRCNALNSQIHLIVGIHILKLLSGIHLDGQEPLIHHALCGLAHLRGTVTSYPGIYLDRVTGLSAKQLVYRRIVKFSFDVPQCLVNPCYRTHQYRPAAVKPSTVHDIPMILYIPWILPHQIFHQFLNRCLNGGGLSLNDWFTPTCDPFISFYL